MFNTVGCGKLKRAGFVAHPIITAVVRARSKDLNFVTRLAFALTCVNSNSRAQVL